MRRNWMTWLVCESFGTSRCIGRGQPVAKASCTSDLLDSLQAELTSCSFDHANLEPLSARLQGTIDLVYLWVTKPSTVDNSTRPRGFQVQCHKLWNICVRSRRSRRTWAEQESEETRGERNTTLMSVWLLSFLCLELNQLHFNKPGDQVMQARRVMELMVPIVNASINDLNLETARLALQRGAANLHNLDPAAAHGDKQLPHDKTSLNLQAKYYAMRIWLVSLLSYRQC